MRIPKVFSSCFNNDEIQEQILNLNHLPEMSYSLKEDYNDEKEYVKIIKVIERIIRSSYEYKNYVKYLKDEVDMNACSFFNNLSREDISIEIHHAPLTLFEIASIVFNKHIFIKGDSIDIYDVANEVMECHYDGKVGLIPLSLTVHQLVHRGDIFVPVNCVFGDVRGFYNEYKEFFKDEMVELLRSHIKTTKQINKDQYKPSVLDRKFTYINIDGISLPKAISFNKEKEKVAL